MAKSVLKKRREWLEALEEPYKAKAIQNSNNRQLNQRVSSIGDALMTAFVWEESPEGHEYWADVYLKKV